MVQLKFARPYGIDANPVIDLGTQCRDPVFVFVLHPGLTGHRAADQIVAKDQVGGGAEVADRHDPGKAKGKRGHPGSDRHVADLVAARQDDDMLLPPLPEDLICCLARHRRLPFRLGRFRPVAWDDYTGLRLTTAEFRSAGAVTSTVRRGEGSVERGRQTGLGAGDITRWASELAGRIAKERPA